MPSYQQAMTNRESVLADLYPLDFDTDRNGFRHDWQGVALLPFVDEARLTAVYVCPLSFVTL